MLLYDIGQNEQALTLLHQACGSGEGTAGEFIFIYNSGTRGRLWRAGHSLLCTAALDPCRRINREDIGRSAVSDTDRHVLVATHEQVVVGSGNGSAILNLGTSTQDEWRRSNGDILQFAQEEADMRRLIIAFVLPAHTVTILMVVPEGIEGIVGSNGSGKDAQGRIVAGAQHHLLAPVTQDVALSRGVTF